MVGNTVVRFYTCSVYITEKQKKQQPQTLNIKLDGLSWCSVSMHFEQEPDKKCV